MNKNTLQILWLGMFMSIISVLYFFSMIFGVPFIITAIISLACGPLLYLYLFKGMRPVEDTDSNKVPLYILAGGVILLTGMSAIIVRKHGDTDAIGNWNFIARYISDKSHWKQLFGNSTTAAHPDYQWGYPGCIAFFWRLFNTRNEIVSLAITYIPTICIPVLIFLRLYKKHLPIATAIFLLFTNTFYLNIGLDQYADVLLSFYLLGAIIAISYYNETGNAFYILLCTALLGCGLWVKNEGLIICGAFALFYLRTFLKKKNIRYAVAGILPFLLTFVIFKIVYAPPNDLIALSNGNHPLSLITDRSRYKLILSSLTGSFDTSFYFLKILIIVYLGYSIVIKSNLNKNFYLLSIVLLAYLIIYLVTPRDLEWHLRTSLSRLILQLFPSFLFVIGMELCRSKYHHLILNNKLTKDEYPFPFIIPIE